MCGLVGVMGSIAHKEEKVMKTLLTLDAVRGDHSTGIVGVNPMGKALTLKKAGGPAELKQYKAYDKVFAQINHVIMGHNRYATQGAINHVNAHPFEFDKIIGMHNGTLRNKYILPEAKDFEVDSENLYYAIEKDGLQETIKKVNGAYSLTWYDKGTRTVNFLRNGERPMCMCRSEDGKTLFWASEEWMLSVALSREGIKFGDIMTTDIHTHYSFDFTNYKVSDKIVAPVAKVLEVWKAPVVAVKKWGGQSKVLTQPSYHTGGLSVELEVSGYSAKGIEGSGGDYLICKGPRKGVDYRIFTHKGSDLWDSMWGARDKTVWTGKTLGYSPGAGKPFFTIESKTLKEKGEVEYVGAQGKKLSEGEWKERVKTGCCISGCDITSPSEIADWFDDDNPVCVECMGGFESINSYLGGP